MSATESSSAVSLSEALRSFLKPAGLAEAGRRDAVVAAVDDYMRGRNLDVEVVSLRWGVLTLRSDAPTCRLLGYERDNILMAAEAAESGAVTELVLHVC